MWNNIINKPFPLRLRQSEKLPVNFPLVEQVTDWRNPHLESLHDTGMFQHAARSRAVCKESRAVFLGRDSKTDGILRHGDGTVSDQSVEAEARNMQNVFGPEIHLLSPLPSVGASSVVR